MVSRIVPTRYNALPTRWYWAKRSSHAKTTHTAKAPQASAVPKSAAMKAGVTAATLMACMAATPCAYTLRYVRWRIRNPDAHPRGDVAADGAAQRPGRPHARCCRGGGRFTAGGVRPLRFAGGADGGDGPLRGRGTGTRRTTAPLSGDDRRGGAPRNVCRVLGELHPGNLRNRQSIVGGSRNR